MEQKGEGCDYSFWSSRGCGHSTKEYKAKSVDDLKAQIAKDYDLNDEYCLEHFKEEIKSIRVYEVSNSLEIDPELLGTIFGWG